MSNKILLQTLLFENEENSTELEEIKGLYFDIFDSLRKIVVEIESYKRDQAYNTDTPSLNIHNQSDRKYFNKILSRFTKFVKDFRAKIVPRIFVFDGTETAAVVYSWFGLYAFDMLFTLGTTLESLENLDIELSFYSIPEAKLVRSLLNGIITPAINEVEEKVNILKAKNIPKANVLYKGVLNIKERILKILDFSQVSSKPTIKKETVRKIEDLYRFFEKYIARLTSNAAQGTAIVNRLEQTKDLVDFIIPIFNSIALGNSYDHLKILKDFKREVSDSEEVLSKSFIIETEKKMMDIFISLNRNS